MIQNTAKIFLYLIIFVLMGWRNKRNMRCIGMNICVLYFIFFDIEFSGIKN